MAVIVKHLFLLMLTSGDFHVTTTAPAQYHSLMPWLLITVSSLF